MKTTEKSAFQFNGFQILKSHIEKKGLGKVGKDLNLDFNPRGERDIENETFTLFLEVIISNKDKSFFVEVEAVGFFKFSVESTLDSLLNYFYLNAPAILFPYIRAYISTLTTLSGFETITLPTINFTFLKETIQKNTKEIHKKTEIKRLS